MIVATTASDDKEGIMRWFVSNWLFILFVVGMVWMHLGHGGHGGHGNRLQPDRRADERDTAGHAGHGGPAPAPRSRVRSDDHAAHTSTGPNEAV